MTVPFFHKYYQQQVTLQKQLVKKAQDDALVFFCVHESSYIDLTSLASFITLPIVLLRPLCRIQWLVRQSTCFTLQIWRIKLNSIQLRKLAVGDWGRSRALRALLFLLTSILRHLHQQNANEQGWEILEPLRDGWPE